MSKKPFHKPQINRIELYDIPEGADLASLSDEEFLEMLRRNRYEDQKICFRVSGQFILREIVGQTVLVPVDGAQLNGMVSITSSGAYLLELMREQRTQADLAYALMKEYGIEKSTAFMDAGAFIYKAMRDGLIIAC